MAGTGQRGKSAVVKGAVGNGVGRWEGVGKNAGAAATVDVAAVVRSSTTRGRRGLSNDASQAGGDGGAGGSGGGFEVLAKLGRRTASGGSGGGAGERGRVGQSSAKGGQLRGAAGAGLDRSTLDQCLGSSLDLSSLGAVDIDVQDIAFEEESLVGKLGAVRLSDGQGANGGNLKLAALGKVVRCGDLNLLGDALAGGNGDECRLGKTGVMVVEHDTFELNLLACNRFSFEANWCATPVTAYRLWQQPPCG